MNGFYYKGQYNKKIGESKGIYEGWGFEEESAIERINLYISDLLMVIVEPQDEQVKRYIGLF